jgi:signal transduction histidine kinase
LRRRDDRIDDLAHRLTASQEAERARVARELHDDIGQRLAALSIALSGIKRHPEIQESPDLRSAVGSLQERATVVAKAIRQLSHDLHPSVLDHATLSEALKSHCTEFARQHSIDVTFNADADLDPVDRAAALCLYRVAQEALRNVAKHAHARSVRVALRRNGAEMTLSVADDGVGFDVGARNRQRDGLGLRSLQERIRLAHGRMSIQSAKSAGTTLSASLPVALEQRQAHAVAKVH